MKTIKIDEIVIGQKFKPFVIAEVGVNHNGKVDTAKKLISLAKNFFDEHKL